MYLSRNDGAPSPPPGVDNPKRSSQVLYHHPHPLLTATGAWYSLTKRAKYNDDDPPLPSSHFPQRPGERDCSHFMLTRTCKFGITCKFDHPSWVPIGGIPDWKEVPLIPTDEPPPQRPGQPDCPYFIKTQRCKYGSKCKFNHPQHLMSSGGLEETKDSSVLPDRPSEPSCAFYIKTGKCKFGASCKFHHPKDISMSLVEQESDNGGQADTIVKNDITSGDLSMINTQCLINQALFHNSKGLPIRMGEVDCPFYMRTGSCKYGTSCRYNHPDITSINAPAILASSSAYNLDMGIVNSTGSIYQTIDTRLPQSMLGVGPTVHPQRPGQPECDYYIKTGECKYGETCKFHHPIDRVAPAAKLTLAGLPRREGAVHCPYYMKTGTCKYGATCKFDHPTPGEVMGIRSQDNTDEAEGT